LRISRGAGSELIRPPKPAPMKSIATENLSILSMITDYTKTC